VDRTEFNQHMAALRAQGNVGFLQSDRITEEGLRPSEETNL